MIKTKAELIEYMRAHPKERLEFCSGTRGPGWWWMRVPHSSNVTKVHGRAAEAVRRAKLIEAEATKHHYDPQYFRLADNGEGSR